MSCPIPIAECECRKKQIAVLSTMLADTAAARHWLSCDLYNAMSCPIPIAECECR